jgi:hypothetical protein
MKTAYGGTHFFLVGTTPTGMVPERRMLAIHPGGNENPSRSNPTLVVRHALCVAAMMLS